MNWKESPPLRLQNPPPPSIPPTRLLQPRQPIQHCAELLGLLPALADLPLELLLDHLREHHAVVRLHEVADRLEQLRALEVLLSAAIRRRRAGRAASGGRRGAASAVVGRGGAPAVGDR